MNTLPQQQPLPQQIQSHISAQQAQQSFQIPQPSMQQQQPQQLPPDVILNDDDSTIQDMLNKYAVTDVPSNMEPPPGYGSMPQNIEPMTNIDNIMMQQNQMLQQQQSQQSIASQQNPHNYLTNIVAWNYNDIKIAIYVIVAYLIVTFLPIETLIFKYVQLQKIPYSNVIIKAVLAGIIVYLLMKVRI